MYGDKLATAYENAVNHGMQQSQSCKVSRMESHLAGLLTVVVIASLETAMPNCIICTEPCNVRVAILPDSNGIQSAIAVIWQLTRNLLRRNMDENVIEMFPPRTPSLGLQRCVVRG